MCEYLGFCFFEDSNHRHVKNLVNQGYHTFLDREGDVFIIDPKGRRTSFSVLDLSFSEQVRKLLPTATRYTWIFDAPVRTTNLHKILYQGE